MTRVEAEAGEVVAAGRPPFLGVVPDALMVDKEQAQIFAAVGGTRGLFDGVAGWPDLNRLVAGRSSALLSGQGHDAWIAAGGAYDDGGGHTLQARSPLGLAVVREVAEGPGRLTWTDPSGTGWAVRLVRRGDVGPGAYLGFAVTRPGVERGPVRTEQVGDDRSAVGRHGGGPGPTARRLWLYERAEQMLWAVHAAVSAQRQSVALLPDVLLGQVVWGGGRDGWPRDWRGDLFRVLGSLTWLHAATLRLDERSWQPRFGTHSVGIAYVEDPRVTRAPDACAPACPMWRADHPHGHFRVQVGYGFLGVLERFAGSDDGAGERTYDFSTRPGGEAGRELRADERAGRLVTVSGPTKLFGPAAWSGLEPSHRGVVGGLMAEVTRPRKRDESDRRDRAAVLAGEVVPGAGPKSEVTCPLLRPGGRHITFGGNGRRPGMGYRHVGAAGRGWLDKCGYAPPAEEQGWRRVARAFLGDLGRVAGLLGLVAAGFDPHDGSWFDLGEMRAMAGTGPGWRRLDSLHLRVYGPEDYLDRLRGHFASAGGFASIPGPASAGPARRGPLDLATRMGVAGVTQGQLALALGVTQPFVSQVLAGKRPWPEGMGARAEALVLRVEAVGTVDAGG